MIGLRLLHDYIGYHSLITLILHFIFILKNAPWCVGVSNNWTKLLWFQTREYELNEVFHHAEDDKKYDLVKLDQSNTISVINSHNNDIQLEMEAERREQEMRLQQQLATRWVWVVLTKTAGAKEEYGIPFVSPAVLKDPLLNEEESLSQYSITPMGNCIIVLCFCSDFNYNMFSKHQRLFRGIPKS